MSAWRIRQRRVVSVGPPAPAVQAGVRRLDRHGRRAAHTLWLIIIPDVFADSPSPLTLTLTLGLNFELINM